MAGRPSRANGRAGLQIGTGWYEMPTATQPVATGLNLSDARCEALFASALQPSDAPSGAMVSKAITCAVRQFGVGRMCRPDGAGVRRPP